MRPVYLCSVAFIVLASCAFHANNWQGSSRPGKDKASFDYFNGKQSSSIRLAKDELLFVEYAIGPVKGAISLSVTQKKQVLWHKQLTMSDSAGFYVAAPETGDCIITVTGDHAAGSFDINYSKAAPRKVSVKTSKNIELYGLMIAIDDGPDIIKRKDTIIIDGRRATFSQWYAAIVQNYVKYKPFDTCKIMSIYRRMEAQGYSYEFFVEFLLKVDEAPFARINALTDPATIHAFSQKGDTAEARLDAASFLAALNDFYKAVDFDSYWVNKKNDYTLAGNEVTKNLPSGDLLPVMEHYYRKRFNNYYFVPSLNIFTSMGFGKTNRSSGTIYNTFGPFSFQSFDSLHPVMAFDYPEKIKGLAVHEFGHSFANPAIDNLPQSLIDSTAYLYEPIKQQMSSQAYTSWIMSLYEHFVRAGEVIIAEKLGDTARAKTIMEENVHNGFKYLPFLVAELKAWDKNPSSGKSFNDAVFAIMEHLKKMYKQ